MSGLVHVCRLCKSRRSAHKIKYRCGTRIERKIGDCVWYPGVIEGHEEKQEHKIINHIRYDDGDTEELENLELRKKDTVKILGEGTSSNKKTKLMPEAKQREVIEIDDIDDEAVPAMPTPQETTCTSTLAAVKQEESLAPDEQPSGRHIMAPVKHEGNQQNLNQDTESIKTEVNQQSVVAAKTEEQLQDDHNDSEAASVAKTAENQHGHTAEITSPVAVTSGEPINEDARDGKTGQAPTTGQVVGASGLLDSEKEDRDAPRNRQTTTNDEASVLDSSGSNTGTEDNTASVKHQDDSVPDVQLSEAQVVRQEVLTDVRQDARVKAEKCTSSLSPEELQKRELCFHKWKLANTDPDTQKGRYVFRRGCYAQCITKILGGSGMQPFPQVKNPPNVNTKDAIVDWEVNPFIKPGEFYVAGNEAWNPFGPRFPGDRGFVLTAGVNQNPEQEEFHVFVECANKPSKRLWHGKLAAGGRMYVGVYRLVDDEDYIESSVRFASDTDLDFDNKLSVARDYVRYSYNEFGKNNLGPEIEAKHVTMAKRLRQQYGEEYGKEQDWASLDERDKDDWTMLAYLIDTDYTWHVAPIKFVRFDEALYQSLVKFDCIMGSKTKKKRVSLESTVLQYYF
ncbi:expressed unknown protein [Seminavis robusta]|uniref:DUF6697 domain-containing protein n=1 Tax=Seminavis robusta TaxID=568900 RepID=A0A9N8H8L3_9STRA|nr:expressed unknown protein [Seminavis robusta]|eukprot:Sro163_g073290.1 n/a (622) ;mRNA; f:63283-65230